VNIVWSPRAIEHPAHLRSYIARDNPTAANRIGGVLLDAVERLAELPNLGRPGRVAGTRELVVPGTPYLIPYELCPS
jgi:toxin ParE1/3/4